MTAERHHQHSTNTVTVNLSTNSTFQYDPNGNLISDGLRAFSYDDENQLIQVLVTNQWMSQFQYDGKMRRRIRKEFTWASTAWAQTNVVYYVYDGNVVIQERDQNNLPNISYTRGKDLSGSLQGAGGIGGLLARTDNTLAQTAYYHADANGNVTMLINSTNAIVAKYLYDAFGNVLSASGQLANANLYRFSSKEAHPNSGLYYCRYRYYEPDLQRWLNRDPVGEKGGINLYRFVWNSPVNLVDPLGLEDSGPIGILHVSSHEHNNYLIFNISCPKGFEVANVVADYHDSTMLSDMYQWYMTNGAGRLEGNWAISEHDYESDIYGNLHETFGGIQNPSDYTPKLNCQGLPVQEHAYMRTRLVSSPWYLKLWRGFFDSPDPASMEGLYQLNTTLHFTCDSCCNRGN